MTSTEPDPGGGNRRPVVVPCEARHADEVVEVIGRVFAEYGMAFEPQGYDADLLDIPGSYFARGGWFGVIEDAGRVVGTVAVVPRDTTTCEIKRVYLLPEYRGRGYGRALVERVLGWARDRGCRTAIAWSDVRLETAHAVYERMGFERFGERTVDDIDRSREIGFRKDLGDRTARWRPGSLPV